MLRGMVIHFLLFIVTASVLNAQIFQDFLNQLNSTPEIERQTLVDSFLTATPNFPLTEDSLAHFIYIGSGSNLAVPGDFNDWNPVNAPMTNISGTNFWYRTEVFEDCARLDYKINYNGIWIFDPRNPFRAPGGIGDNSELRMPNYIPPAEIDYNSSIPHGTFEDTIFFSYHLHNSRQIIVYLPPGYDQSTKEYPVVLMHDGLEYISLAKMNNVIDYLIYKNEIQPIISIFVPPINRTEEYIDSSQQAYTNFIIQELIPWIDNKYSTNTDPAFRAVMGSSAGGNISMWIGINHPDVIGNVGAFSSYVEDDIQTFLENSHPLKINFYIMLGTYDLPVIKQTVTGFIPALQTKGYNYQFEEFYEGHSYGLWRAHLDDALIMFFPATSTSP